MFHEQLVRFVLQCCCRFVRDIRRGGTIWLNIADGLGDIVPVHDRQIDQVGGAGLIPG